MRPAVVFRAVVLLLFVAPALAAQRPDDRLTLEHYLQWESVANPQLSPDGRQIVYTRRFIDPVNDRWDSQVWIMSADGRRARYVLDGSSPVWSPDGTRIAYLAEGNPRGTQIFVRWMDAEGAVSQVTRVEQNPSNIAWAPDGRSIAFNANVPSRTTWRINLPQRPRGARWAEDPLIIERRHFRRDRIGYLPEGHRHIFVVSADGGQARQVTRGDFDYGGPEWSPDGRTIVFSGLLEPDSDERWRESYVYAVDVATGETRQVSTEKGPFSGPVYSPDGRFIAFTGHPWTDDTFVERDLYVMNADGSNPRNLTAELDRTPIGLRWAADGSGIYFNANDEGVRNLYFAPVRGQIRQVTRGNHILTVTDMNRAGLAVGTLTAPQEPDNVVAFDVGRPEPRRLTRSNEAILSRVRLGEVEEIWYESVDDYRIQGWLIKPPDFEPTQQYPLMLVIHGGPHAMYNVGFNFGWQEHAANGYLVLYTNPRGSSGYGSAFGNAIKRAYPGRDYYDLIAGVDVVVARGYVDEANMFVYGCSGGGVLTAWVVAHTDRFAAASSNCPVTNWLSFVGTTDGTGWYRNFDSYPWDDPSEHLRRSPLMYVGNVKTPTMLMTGEKDLRTPMAQTEEYYQALQVLGVPTAMIRFPDEWHGTSSRPSNFLRTQLYLRSWFERHGTMREREPVVAGEGEGS